MANIEADIRQLESLSNKDKNLGDVFYPSNPQLSP